MIEGHLYTEGIVGSDYPENIKAQIAALPDDCQIVIHHIKSPGGNVYAAWKAIPELMKIGKPIKSIIEGEASSIASWIAIAPAAEVEVTDPSTMLVHEPFYPEGIDGALRIDDLENAKTELAQIRQSMAEAYAKKAQKPVEEMLALMKSNTRLTAGMMKSYGLVDKVTPSEPRRIAAQVMNEIKQDFETLKKDLMSLFGKKAVAAAPTAIDLPLKDGKMLNVNSENGDLVNKPATIDGVPAEGVYNLADGRQITCAGGVVTAVTEAGLPPETEAQRIQKELLAAQTKLAEIQSKEAERVKAEEETKRVAAETQKLAEAAKALEESKQQIAALAEKVKELENQPIGDRSKPFEGMKPVREPYGKANSEDQRKIEAATRTFLATNLPHLERYYPGGKFKDGTRFIDYRENGPSAVSILETNLNYTWNGILDTNILFKPTIGTPAISDVFNIDMGAADKKRYHIAPVMNKVLKPYTGCGQAVTGSSFDITSKMIQLKPFEMYEGWCKDDFTDQLTGSYNVLAQEWLKTGVDSFDPAGTPIDKMIIKQLRDALRRDTWRRISFGDTTSSSADWNQIDGLWQSLIDQSGASNYCVFRSNTASPFGTGALATDAALNAFKAIYNNSSNLLKQYAIDSGNGQFLVTRSIWENYYDSLVDKGSVSNDEYNNLLTGIKKLTYKGLPVIPITVWDDQLADSTNPLAATTKHLVAFTVKNNHVLGIENTADMDKIDSWFEKKDNKRYYRSNFTMGFLGAIHCELTTIAY